MHLGSRSEPQKTQKKKKNTKIQQNFKHENIFGTIYIYSIPKKLSCIWRKNQLVRADVRLRLTRAQNSGRLCHIYIYIDVGYAWYVANASTLQWKFRIHINKKNKFQNEIEEKNIYIRKNIPWTHDKLKKKKSMTKENINEPKEEKCRTSLDALFMRKETKPTPRIPKKRAPRLLLLWILILHEFPRNIKKKYETKNRFPTRLQNPMDPLLLHAPPSLNTRDWKMPRTTLGVAGASLVSMKVCETKTAQTIGEVTLKRMVSLLEKSEYGPFLFFFLFQTRFSQLLFGFF